MIGSDEVEGTEVYNTSGDHIGIIERVMIDKITGRIAYAVMGFGGILGLGREHYPVPWPLLSYNDRAGGYELNVAEDHLRHAPDFTLDDSLISGGRTGERELYTYYGVTPYW
jgi:hypothetical protein